jgi:uncharacterized membrane protein YdjX (TVP38/TMEM64 family)
MTMVPASTRAVAGAVLLGTIATAAVLVPTATAVSTAESVAADPVRFGLVVAALYLARPLALVPTTPLAIVVGYGYGVALGVPVALAGVVVTVLPVFFVARWFVGGGERGVGRGTIHGRIERLAGRTDRVVRRYYDAAGPVRGVAASRLAPIPSDVSTCAAAISGVRLRQFVIGTMLGELPWTVAAVVLGASAATITTDGFGELGLALTLACALGAVLLLAGPLYRLLWPYPDGREASQSADG